MFRWEDRSFGIEKEVCTGYMIIIFEGGSEIIIVITSRVHVSCAGLSTSPSLLSVGRRAKTDHWAPPSINSPSTLGPS